jgi:hypothetical protein
MEPEQISGSALPDQANQSAGGTPPSEAKINIQLGLLFGIGGVVVAVLSILLISAWGQGHWDFPFARVLALLLLFVFVGSAVAAVRGFVFLVQGLIALVKARR